MNLILASSSPYRKELLARFNLSFITSQPNIDETPFTYEKPWELAQRLAYQKALAVSKEHKEALVIGSDQVAHHNTLFFSKPKTIDKAIEQLRLMRGKTLFFQTAVCLLNTNTQHLQQETIVTEVKMRQLSDEEIQRYILAEKPLDCAGSAKIEGLGISLMESVNSNDPTALIGLPLICLANMLRHEGVALP